MKMIKDFFGMILYMFVMVFLDAIPNEIRKYCDMIKKVFDGEFEIAQSDRETLEWNDPEDTMDLKIETEEEVFKRIKDSRPYYNEHFPFLKKDSLIGHTVGKKEEDEWGDDYMWYSLSFVCRNWFKPFYVIIILLGIPIHALFTLTTTTIMITFSIVMSILHKIFTKD